MKSVDLKALTTKEIGMEFKERINERNYVIYRNLFDAIAREIQREEMKFLDDLKARARKSSI